MRFLKELAPYLARYKAKLIAGLSLIVVATLFQIVTPLLLKIAVDSLEHPAPDIRRFILFVALAALSFALLRSFFQFRGRFTLIATARDIEYDLRNTIFAHLQKLPASFYDTHLTGDLTSRVINDIDAVRNMIGMGLMATTNISLVFLFSITSMILLDWRLTLLAMTPLVLISLVAYFFTRRVHERSLQVQEQLAAISTKAHENFSGIRVIKTFAQEEGEIGHFRKLCAEYQARNMSLATWQNLMSGLFTVLIELGLVITLLIGGTGIIDGTFSRGTLIAFAAYQFMLIWPMIAFGWILNLVQRGKACMERIGQILNTPPAETVEPRRVEAPRLPEKPDIDIRGLSFSYNGGQTWALKDVTLSIPHGRRVCIVGHTGSGKSTLIKLLLKLYPVEQGSITLGGIDLRNLPAQAVRERMAVAPQEPFLFSDTIRENMAFGVQEPSQPWLDSVARSACFSSDIAALPHQWDQVVGERGITLSGGQKQRVAIARALARNPSILVLDDPFSSLDADTERHIMDELHALVRNRTLIIITHRMTVARDADRILVMDEGRIVESGTHEELFARGGLYTTLVNKQKIMAEISDFQV